MSSLLRTMKREQGNWRRTHGRATGQGSTSPKEITPAQLRRKVERLTGVNVGENLPVTRAQIGRMTRGRGNGTE